ncbi:MAG: DUF447 family protein [Candidatus Methanoperedens sp.]|nr:DUF447 family protein [Candidatus Methanoperedens sp.]
MIFTTISYDGAPNAAPIGLHMKDEKIFARIYNSKSLDNIVAKKKAAANIIYDPFLFVESALSDIQPDNFEHGGRFPVLKEAMGWIIFDCRVRKGETISFVELSPVEAQIKHRQMKPINRGFNAVIEATVEATRYVVLKDTKYLDRIEYYDTIVRKCGGLREKEAMKLLFELIGK